MAPHAQRLTVTRRSCALAQPLQADGEVVPAINVVVAELSDGDGRGRGECVPVQRYGESPASVIAELESAKAAIASGLNRDTLQQALPPGAARNALDCAFWDLDAKRMYCSVAELAGLAPGTPLVTAFTLARDTPERMAGLAAANRARPVLRLDLGGGGDLERVQAVRQAAPASRLIIDANEGWSAAQLAEYLPALAELRVELLEQPLPADADDPLAGMACTLLLCADEACRAPADLDRLEGKYQAVNIKLDKVGGLTAALALAAEAKRRGFQVMVAGMVGTSLAIAPALLVAQQASFIDLDGPLHLAVDRGAGLRYDGSTIHPPDPALWGGRG